jgi:hypothetical protein
MGMQCKKCGEDFPKSQPFDLFEFRRHTYIPADPQGTTHSDMVGDGGMFCSRKCLGDYLNASEDASLDLGSMRNRL